MADSGRVRADRLGDRRQGGVRGVRGGGLRQQDAVPLGGEVGRRRGRLGTGLRPGTIRARDVGRIGPSGKVRPRPRARVDPAGGPPSGPRSRAGADPVRSQRDRRHVPRSCVRRGGALGDRSRKSRGRMEDGGRGTLAIAAGPIGGFDGTDHARPGWPGGRDLSRADDARRIPRPAGAATRRIRASDRLAPPHRPGR